MSTPRPPATDRAANRAAAGPVLDGPARVMLVDDDQRLRAVVAELLGESGLCVVAEASSGIVALELAPAVAPAVALVDVRMPGAYNGIETTRRLRANVAGVRVVIFTGFPEPGIEQAARDAGADAVLLKGVSPQRIVLAVQRSWASLITDPARTGAVRYR